VSPRSSSTEVRLFLEKTDMTEKNTILLDELVSNVLDRDLQILSLEELITKASPRSLMLRIIRL
jgi:hypothetical protein